jgi:undecaprenyl-diphosphatase
MNLKDIDLRLAKHADYVEAHKGLRLFLQLITHSCDSWYWLVGIVLLWLLGGKQEKYYAFNLAAGLGFLAVFVLGLKFLIRRPRPEGEWGQVYRITDPHSFPSGHAARAMAVAAMAILDDRLPLGLRVFLVVWAFLVGYSRIALRLHYLSDVVVGWVIGVVSGLLTPVLVGIFARILPGIYAWFVR